MSRAIGCLQTLSCTPDAAQLRGGLGSAKQSLDRTRAEEGNRGGGESQKGDASSVLCPNKKRGSGAGGRI